MLFYLFSLIDTETEDIKQKRNKPGLNKKQMDFWNEW